MNNIKETVNTFGYFIENYEKALPARSTIEDIKDFFKTAHFVEKTIEIIEAKQLTDSFLSCLNTFLDSNDRKHYDLQFYKYACDYAILKYFKGRKFDLDIAMRMYTSFLSEERFQTVLQKAIINSCVNDAVLNYTIFNKERLCLSNLTSKLLFVDFKHKIDCGEVDYVKNTIDNMISNENLPLIVEILMFLTENDNDKILGSIIVKNLIFSEMLSDRSPRSRNLYTTLLKNVNKKLLRDVARKNIDFFNALLNLVIFCANSMRNDCSSCRRVWYSSPDGICPEVTFDDVVDVLKSLIELKGEFAEIVVNCFDENIKKSLIWVDIQKICV